MAEVIASRESPLHRPVPGRLVPVTGEGRPQEGLAHLDALAARRGGQEGWELFWIRLPLMAACGRVDEAVEQTRVHAEGTTSYAAPHIAELLAGAERTEDAVGVLEQQAPANSHALAGYLIDLGRIGEAVAVLQETGPAGSRAGPWHDEPPFRGGARTLPGTSGCGPAASRPPVKR
uniref:Tetratricopeptide repeat protein n=1 Tax=Streptomyces sp. NBC_01393 TaxID=2903851 RepID=A0AAU3IAC4_9ACTN